MADNSTSQELVKFLPHTASGMYRRCQNLLGHPFIYQPTITYAIIDRVHCNQTTVMNYTIYITYPLIIRSRYSNGISDTCTIIDMIVQ